MALFSLRRYSWNFPSNNYGQIFGIADSGVETFNGTPIKSLAREICQNSIDANLEMANPRTLLFKRSKSHRLTFRVLMTWKKHFPSRWNTGLSRNLPRQRVFSGCS